ncbi:putative MFS multidrug transporter [Rhexocercosporidium sp. MPI-PUGE-AT-0058]|nr:putative MFS multidrug transporter [Rhexocercosporidium sp. MPI-PUGE-AT-0058]
MPIPASPNESESRSEVRGHSHLSPEHRDFLLKRHRTVELDPLPSLDPSDPLNWPSWKKNINLAILACQTWLTLFNAAGPVAGILIISKDLNVSITKSTYILGIQALFLGVSPLFWNPIAERFGRRPIWLLSALGGTVFNIGCALAKSYGVLMTMRLFAAVFLSPTLSMGGGVVMETFFARQRGRKLGVWTLAYTLGAPFGPFVLGFVVQNTNSWQWMFWTCAIMSGASLPAIAVFCPETLYNRAESVASHVEPKSAIRTQYLSLGRINPKPFDLREIYEPYVMLQNLCILLPAIGCAMVFCTATIAMSIGIPQAYGQKFHLGPQATGLNYLAIVIGALLGEQIGGPFGDFLVNLRAKRSGGRRVPEYRIWSSYLGFLSVIAGLLQWGITLQNSPVGPWTVIPDIGLGIASFGGQIISTVLMTYAIDCYPHKASVVANAINQVRQIWAFIGPFWFTPMYESIGYAYAGVLMAGLVLIFGLCPMLLCHLFGGKFRSGSEGFSEYPVVYDVEDHTIETQSKINPLTLSTEAFGISEHKEVAVSDSSARE